jgi:hypothetical protein
MIFNVGFLGMFVMLYGIFRWIRTRSPGQAYFNWSITLLMVLCTCYFGLDLAKEYLTLVSTS